jgi:hypothetical protein
MMRGGPTDRLGRSDLAMKNIEDGNTDTASTLCYMSDTDYGNEDTAQTLIAADILARTKTKILVGAKDSINNLKRQGECLNTVTGNDPFAPSSKNSRCQNEIHDLNSTRVQLKEARLDMILKNVSPTCFHFGANANDKNVESQIHNCVQIAQISHEEPFLPFESKAFAKDIDGPTDEEVGAVTSLLFNELNSISSKKEMGYPGAAISPEFSAWWKSIQNQADTQYQGIIANNPTVRFLKTATGTRADFQTANKAATAAATQTQANLRKAPLSEFGRFKDVMVKAIGESPPDYRGDYCEVAGHLLNEVETRQESNRTAINLGVITASAFTGGLAGAAIGAGVSSGQWIFGASEYASRMKECAIQDLCSTGSVNAARDLAALDYSAILFGVGGSGIGYATKFLKEAPAVAHELEAASADATAAGRAKLGEVVANACK